MTLSNPLAIPTQDPKQTLGFQADGCFCPSRLQILPPRAHLKLNKTVLFHLLGYLKQSRREMWELPSREFAKHALK